ncbi:acyltransferase [uncultured Chitinophaga sp.]|uniref:acyltransferase family protein n=1 Tax=uncultured Chitinophaga sp. TaxID=339340 RepID=UPI0025F77EBD|nr:acyltransferase [uncultured Chitinophaga sp.]
MENTNSYIYRGIKYFESLNGLRFMAAYLVVMHHAETIRSKYGLFNLDQLSLFKNGGTAVTFFFVLSGFLITYLLLNEHRKTGRVSVRNFYLRRVLRIWPLYFLLVLIGAVLVPAVLGAMGYPYEMPYTFGEAWPWFLFFMPFMVNFLFGHHLLEPLWSIGVEEVFYLVWAPLVKFLRKHMLVLLYGVIAIKLALLVIASWFSRNELFNFLTTTLQFEAMAIGGLGAWWVYNREQPVSEAKLFSKTVQGLLLSLLVLRLGFHYYFSEYWLYSALFNTPVVSAVVLDLLFLYVILNLSLNAKRLFSLEGKMLNRLGEISYGVYMYHLLLIFGAVLVLKKHLLALSPIPSTLAFYAVVTGGVLLVAGLSKKYFEDPFLRIKNKLG